MTVEFRDGQPASEPTIAAAEAALGFPLAAAFRRFVSLHDGSSPEPSAFVVPDEGRASLQLFLPVAEIPDWKVLIEFFPEGSSYPIALIGTGDVLFMWAGDEAIYFWDHERPDWTDPKCISPSFDVLLAELHAFDPGRLGRITGDRHIDEVTANAASGLSKTPRGFTWHHVEDARTMQLVPSRLHSATGHTGGVAVIQNGGFDRRPRRNWTFVVRLVRALLLRRRKVAPGGD